MDYSISQMAERFGVEPHTLRFYEKEGILAPRRTPGGARRYTEDDAARMVTVMCLRSTGMPLKEIRRYFELAEGGDETLPQRIEMFTRHRQRVLEEIEAMREHLKIIEKKIAWLEGLSAGEPGENVKKL